VPTAIVDGIKTAYEVIGSGPPLLMYSPGGFDATMEKWSTQGIYSEINLLDHVPKSYSCIVFDRRESGQSGGRLERISWAHYAAQGKGLLEHLHIERAHIAGGCMGCSAAIAFGVAYPRNALSLTLYWPAGGAKYRIRNHLRFAEHLSFVEQNGLEKVVERVMRGGKPFGADPCGGPWASVIGHDRAFAQAYARQPVDAYTLIVGAMGRLLFDRDTVPGAEPEDLLRLEVPALIVPGRDASHATSAARYLEECLPRAEYWDAPVSDQTGATVPGRVLEFLSTVPAV